MIRIGDLDDPRLDDYRIIGSPAQLVGRGVLVVEGRRVLRRIIELPRYRLRSILVTTTAFDALADLQSLIAAIPTYVVSQPVMSEVVGFEIHRGCLALAERPPLQTLSAVDLTTSRRIVVMEGVNNPDNVGGIFRSAAAFGADYVVLGPHCGDPLYRKAIRTSMGASLQVPFLAAGAWPRALEDLRASGFRVLALTPAAEALPLGDFDRSWPQIALVVGSEGEGLSAAALATAEARVRIPMTGPAESLNVTVAASIALHHFAGPVASSTDVGPP